MEIKLNLLTYRLFMRYSYCFEQYKFEIFSMLTAANIYYFESDILKTAPFDKMVDGLSVYREKYHSIGQRFNPETKIWEPAYFDFGVDYEITPKNHNYINILIFSLKVLPNDSISIFLDYQLNTFFPYNLTNFIAQLENGILIFGESILNETIIAQVQNWIISKMGYLTEDETNKIAE